MHCMTSKTHLLIERKGGIRDKSQTRDQRVSEIKQLLSFADAARYRQRPGAGSFRFTISRASSERQLVHPTQRTAYLWGNLKERKFSKFTLAIIGRWTDMKWVESRGRWLVHGRLVGGLLMMVRRWSWARGRRWSWGPSRWSWNETSSRKVASLANSGPRLLIDNLPCLSPPFFGPHVT